MSECECKSKEVSKKTLEEKLVEFEKLKGQVSFIAGQISLLQEQIGEMRDGFEKEYGTADVNIHDGIINYTKENGEANKKDLCR